jgi:hypothetical protein
MTSAPFVDSRPYTVIITAWSKEGGVPFMAERDTNGQVSARRWTCPQCGRAFARTNQQHVCDTTTVDDHLTGKPQQVVDLFQRFAALVGACGPFEYAPMKRQVGFRVNRIFAGVQLTDEGLRGYLDLPRRVESTRFRQVSPYTKRLFVHHFAISSADELDDEFAGWIGEAYAVGKGRHRRSTDN